MAESGRAGGPRGKGPQRASVKEAKVPTSLRKLIPPESRHQMVTEKNLRRSHSAMTSQVPARPAASEPLPKSTPVEVSGRGFPLSVLKATLEMTGVRDGLIGQEN